MGVKGAEQYDALARRLREQGDGRLQERLRSGLRSRGRPVVREIQGKATALRITGSKGGRGRPKGDRDLRGKAARSVGLSVTRTGIRFTADGSRVDRSHGTALLRYLDADLPSYRRWRYPVFDTGQWAQNRSSGGFFHATIRARRAGFEQAVQQVCDRTARDIEN
jgi:hypothetical protein